MAIYVDFLFYQKDYGGIAVVSESFKPYALKASAVIDQLTSNRVAAIVAAGTDTDKIEAIKFAACAVIDELIKLEEAGGVIASESVGSHSVTYANTQNSTEAHKVSEAAKLFLANTGLMYRGFYADEYSSDNLSKVSDL